MRKIILILSFIFTIGAFATNLPENNNYNLIIGFFFNSLTFLGEHFFLFLVSFVVIAFLVFRSLRIEMKHPKKNHLLIILTQTGFVFITGAFFAFLILIVLAVIELNLFAYIVDLNPTLLGAQTNINDIGKSLAKLSVAPVIKTTSQDHYKELQAIAQATTGTDSFYGKYILSSIPGLVVLPTGNIGSTILIDKTLIISAINKKDLEKITPIIVYSFIKSYFPNREIKHFPKVTIMSIAEYTKFRQADYADKFNKIKQQIANTNKLIASTSAQITTDEDLITQNKDIIKTAYTQRDKQMNSCINQGNYDKSNKYVRTNTQDYCLSLVKRYDDAADKANNNIDFYTQELDKNNKLLKAYQAYADFFESESKLTDSLKVNIPLEVGLYVPPSEIKIVLNTSAQHGVADYFETVTHEYLHYASHQANGKPLNVALFEEGLTEYFAKNIIKNSLKVDTTLGYPVFVKILDQITKIIPEEELADYYFTKDEKGLEKSLNRVYGDNFYQENTVLFETLQYAFDNKQLLKFANSLINKINGEPLTEDDLISAPVN
jgi:hypothetical protein